MDIDPPPTLRAIPDHTPTPSASDTPAPRQIVDDQAAPPPSLAFSLGSLRTLLIVGTAITATLAIIAVVLGNSDAPAEPASASTTAAVTSPASSAAPSPPGSAAASPAATRPAPVAATTRPTPIEPSPASRTAPVKPSPASPASPAGSAPPSRPSPAAPHPPRTSPSSRGKPVAMTTSPSAIRTSRPLRSERPQRAGPRVASSQRTAPKRTVRGPSLRKVDPEAAAALAADNEPAVAQARAAYAAGNESLFAGDFDTAIRSYRRAVAQAPSYAAGYRGLGLAYAVQGDSDQAIKALRTYLNLAPQAKDVALIKRRIASLQAGHP